MVFSSMIFLFLFLPLLFVFYFAVPKKFRNMRNVVLLIFSLIFYAANEPINILVMVASVFVNYGLGIAMERIKYRKLTVLAAVTVNLGILIYFKYTNFIFDTITNISGIEFAIKKIIMPVGISFYTFQGMSYVLDIYFGKAKAQRNPFNVMLYIVLFPQLVAGPIVRYKTVETEIAERSENEKETAEGFSLFMIGFAKKLIIANEVGQIADLAFAEPQLTVFYAWLGAICYTLQIYFDFSAYSDMAIGLGKVFGFHFPKNFDYPYISKSVTEFWRRWHISLGTWFRDYLYIPLGGNKCSKAKHIRNIMAVWLATGIWHGASMNFIFWGLYYGVLLIIEKEFLGKYLQKLPKIIGHIYTMLAVITGFVFFRADTLTDALEYLRVMFGGASLFEGNEIQIFLNNLVIILAGVIGSFPVYKLFENIKFRMCLKFIYCTGVFVVGIVYLTSSTFNPFIYFRF